MHEFSYGDAILERALARAQGRPLARIRVRAGASHALVPEALQQAFAMKAAGTPAEGAEVDLVVIPVPLRCGACGAEAAADGHIDARGRACDACEAGWMTPLPHGDELMLESLEYRSAQPPRGGPPNGGPPDRPGGKLLQPEDGAGWA